jgi:hypothetical protein
VAALAERELPSSIRSAANATSAPPIAALVGHRRIGGECTRAAINVALAFVNRSRLAIGGATRLAPGSRQGVDWRGRIHNMSRSRV